MSFELSEFRVVDEFESAVLLLGHHFKHGGDTETIINELADHVGRFATLVAAMDDSEVGRLSCLQLKGDTVRDIGACNLARTLFGAFRFAGLLDIDERKEYLRTALSGDSPEVVEEYSVSL